MGRGSAAEGSAGIADTAGAPRREFLGWTPSVASEVARRLADERGADLGGLLVAVPSARLGRRLVDRLAEELGPRLVPPRVVTAGRLSDALLGLEGRAAARTTRTLVWADVLRETDGDTLGAWIAEPPRAEATGAWLALADVVRALHAELGAHALGFADVVERAGARERRRWTALADVQRRYERRLDALGLLDPHLARRQRLARGAVRDDRDVVLLAVPELAGLARGALAPLGARTTAYVLAPDALADAFDAWGALRDDAWRARDIPVDRARWLVADRPPDQADLARETLGAWSAAFGVEHVALGVLDDEVAPFLERALAELHARDRGRDPGLRLAARPTPLARTPPLRAVTALARLVEGRRFDDLAALVRHPDVERLCAEEGDARGPIEHLDEYAATHVPGALAVRWPGRGEHARACTRLTRRLADAAADLLPDGERATVTRPPAAWVPALAHWLEALYARDAGAAREGTALVDRSSDEGRTDEAGADAPDLDSVDADTDAALVALADALAELAAIPDAVGPVGAADALRLLARAAGERARTTGEATSGVLEPVGWVDLLGEDAHAVLVTGFNEGRVPEPERLASELDDEQRATLGLPPASARLARDAYLLTALLHTHEHVVLVTGRRRRDNDPLLPSRLLFHAPEDDVVARVRAFVGAGEREAGAADSPPTLAPARALPQHPSTWVPEAWRVTAFGDYLASPYLFYLRHVLRLEPVDDRARELDPRTFGSLVHQVLEDFGEGEARDSADAERIEADVLEHLDARVAARFGARPLPAVRVQIERLRHRLRAFAREQAELVREGWRIAHVEWVPEGGGVAFDVDGVPVQLRGRIDRIDRHESDGRVRIIDYKTSEKAKAPRVTHGPRDGRWHDLQLPLYRRLAAELELGDDVELGYFSLPSEIAKTGWAAGAWTSEELAAADEVAREIVRAARARRFDDVGDASAFHDPGMAALAGVGLLGAGEDGADEDEA